MSLSRLPRNALLLFLLVAFGAQQWALQTHVHTPGGGEAAVSAPAGDTGDARHAGCLLCQAASHAGVAAPPAVLRLVEPGFLFSIRLPAGSDSGVPSRPAHAWYSRGPPAA